MGREYPNEGSYIVAMVDAIKCPINLTLFLICVLLGYLSLRPLLRRNKSQKSLVPKMGKRDFTLEELQNFDGSGEHKRILLAVNGKIFDVTNKGQEFYGRGAPYAAFAGKDASRALACFNLETKDEYDDLSDLTADQMKTLREWELQFSERYDHIGRLLKPGEPHRVYEINDGDDDVGVNHVQGALKEKLA
ncbi:Membrane-associated progesterone receptor component 2 [Schistosoma japonicum]|nr:Membrane-associated progesterone receptor component 2 [Schistosoma japonicum]